MLNSFLTVLHGWPGRLVRMRLAPALYALALFVAGGLGSPAFAWEPQARISSGYDTSCAVSERGLAECWGAVPLRPTGFGAAVDVKAGQGFNCALLPSGAVSCFGKLGSFDYGLPGAGASSTTLGTPIAGVAQAVELAVGATHACARTAAGQVHCWGDASQGQLGAAAGASPAQAVPIHAWTGVAKIAAGRHVTCAVLQGGAVSCLGSGSLLAGADADPATPRRVPFVSDATDVSIFDGHGCVLRAGGQLACWGRNATGALGVPAGADAIGTIVDVPDLGGAATAIATGEAFSCARLQGGALKCWGSNASGQLGIGHGKSTATPQSGHVLGISDALAVSAGQTHACAVLDGGYVNCWGSSQGTNQGFCHDREVFYPGEPYEDKAVPSNCETGIQYTPMAVTGIGPAADYYYLRRAVRETFPNETSSGFDMDDSLGIPYIKNYKWSIFRTGNALGINGHGTPHLFFQGPTRTSEILDLGPLADWMRLINGK